jgi:hypothetical protein
MLRPSTSLRPCLLLLPLLLVACADSSAPPPPPTATGCTRAADCAEPGALCLVGGVCCTPSAEACDGRDNDCDGQVDEGLDLQTDAQNCGRCDQACTAAQTCVAGACEEQHESACTGGADEDSDGQADCADADCQGAACAEGCLCDAGGKRESACRDGQDNDGDGQTDCADADCPATACGTQCGETADCAGAAEVCVLPAGGGTPGTCCTPSTEVCDGEDNDCNGTPDDVALSACYSGPAGTRDVGRCKAGVEACNGATSACVGEVLPAAETCNEADDDCDGQVDELWNLQTDRDHCGRCGQACHPAASCVSGQCVAPATESLCSDGVDEDGDGRTDCADTEDCANASCGAGCVCTGGGFRRETQCADGLDNDGDANTDCRDTDCIGQSCGGTRTCRAGGACTEV